jgi:hypothetical protein
MYIKLLEKRIDQIIILMLHTDAKDLFYSNLNYLHDNEKKNDQKIKK